ncbi:MAG: L-rhamnose isomerase [Candidatus Latescibacteria bacterium]|nr:L-rhamnose isomerase [Candidatus Latescibacterota bacterium]
MEDNARLSERLEEMGKDVKEIKNRLKAQRLETPSWGYGNAGTRFAVFEEPGAARDIHERLEDASEVHRLTGICPSVAVHIPWDKVADYEALKAEAESLGVQIGAVNPNLFQDPAYKMGSLTNVDAGVRGKAVDHLLECVEIMEAVDSRFLSLWFGDGTNYPGQGDFRRRKAWMEEGLSAAYERLPEGARMLVEYKFFEPAFYHTDIAGWGMAYAFCRNLGAKAQVLVDLGHHPLATNIEHIVAFLLSEGKLGGFHFNNKKYADDDLTVGSIAPYELFLIYAELAAVEEDPAVDADVAYMIDQSHAIKPKIQAMLQSVMHLQTAYAKALLVDRKALGEAQEQHDAVLCERILQTAFQTDVAPLLTQVRTEMGLDPDPLMAYRGSGYAERIVDERG